MPVNRLKSEVNALNILNHELVQKIKKQEAEIALLQDNSLELIDTLNISKNLNSDLQETVSKMIENTKNFLLFMKSNNQPFELTKIEQSIKN